MSSASCTALVKDYCSNTTFTGVHFIADDTKHWLERVLWVGLVALSWYGSGLLVGAAWEDFTTSPISFGVETTYTEWNTNMPAVAVCETENQQKLYDVSDMLWTPQHLVDLEDALQEIVYYRGQSDRLMELCYDTHEPDPNCPTSNYTNLSYLVRSHCPQLITNCSYNAKPFDCCEYFQPIDADVGKCFIINSLQTPVPKPYPMVNNMTNKRGLLRFNTLLYSTMYTIGKEEVPSTTTSESYTKNLLLGRKYTTFLEWFEVEDSLTHAATWGTHRAVRVIGVCQTRHLAVKHIENDPLLVQYTPEQRKCLFPEENKDGLYPLYSFSACNVRCRKKAQLATCGCNDHLMLDTDEEDRCNLTGLACLHRRAMALTTLKPRWAKRPGLYCDCLPSCNETDITVIRDIDTLNLQDRKKAYVKVELSHLPTERYKRSVVRSRLDLVVSVGGTIGLFVGASLLSFVELFFYFTVRYVNNFFNERKRQKKKNRTRFFHAASKVA